MFSEFLSDGLLLRRDAWTLGISDDALGRAVRRRDLVRIRQGAYVSAAVWDAADAATQHRLLTTATLRLYDGDIALSHSSAALQLGAPSWGLDLSAVHVTHFRGHGRRVAQVTHHQGRCGVDDLTKIAGHWVTTPARTVIDTCQQVSLEAGVVLASDVQHRGLTTAEELEHFRK